MYQHIKVIAFALAACLAVGLLVGPAIHAAAPVTVRLNGVPISFDVSPVIENGRTLVPFRAIGEALGVQVHWDNANRRVIAEKGNLLIELPVNQTTANVSGQNVTLDVPATIRQGRTLVPLRFFSQAFGAAVHWNDSSRTVTINTGPQTAYILGYYYSYSYQDFLQNYHALSGVATKWYTLDDNSRLTWQANRRGIFAPEGYEEVLQKASSAGAESYALVFEDNSDKLHQLLSNPAQQKLLCQDIINLLNKEGFSGVNIDFEMVREADGPALTAFINNLAQLVHAQGKKLALSVPARTTNGWNRAYDYAALGQVADQIAIMAYDRSPGQASPQTPIYWIREVVDYAVQRIPAHKVLLGLGTYGYDWANGGRRTVLWAPSELGSLVSYLEEIKARYHPEIKWDNEAMQPYFTYTDEQGSNHTVWYENIDSLKPKLDLVREKGLGGIAFWRLGYTTPEFYQLIQSYFAPQKF
ncbi:MAG: stalk domain-containing protein [bacterium]|jgi:spore germination protein